MTVRLQLAIATCVLCVCVALTGCGGAAGVAAPAADPDNPQAVKGAELVKARCRMCHSLDRVYQKQSDAAGWQITLAQMKRYGLALSSEEESDVLAYLTTMTPAK